MLDETKRKKQNMLKTIRRMITAITIAAAAVVLLFLYARYVEPNRLITKTFTIETEKEIEDCKAVFFTDTHFGAYYDVEHIDKIAAKINEQEADIVIFGGDLLDNYARDRKGLDLEYLREGLSKIEAGSGKFAVFGNHDYGGGAVRIYEAFMTSCGFQVLEDESQILEAFNIKIIGYDDYLLGWTDPSLYEVKSDRFNIIVAHEPIISQFIESSSDNFMLSGHTHGGQVTIPILTKKLLPEGSGQFVKGMYEQTDIGTDTSLRMYTSSGIGLTKYPIRLFNVPEIITVEFVKAEK